MDIMEIVRLIITSITSIIAALITAGFFKTWWEKKSEFRSRKKLVGQIESDTLVYQTLKQLKHDYNCDRIYIIQFHNGDSFYTESPMQKASATYEVCSPGLERVSDKFQGVLVSHYSWYIFQSMKNEMFYYNVEHVEDATTKSLLNYRGAQSHCGVPLYDDKKHLVGLFCADWVFSEVPDHSINGFEFTEEYKKEFYTQGNSLVKLMKSN
jgi:hypothetical protein